ncbi:MAG: TldD/PmbA family protein [Candidatus Heimdallarchaeota archaeon]|nr:TldD/PmbA family protein [Candidatus Heimdallarchaeota archaeon]
MRDSLERITNYCTDNNASFCEVRVSNLLSNLVQVNNNAVNVIEPSASTGASVRVLSNGSWGFASTNDLTPDSLQNVADKALKLAKINNELSLEKVEIIPSKTISKDIPNQSTVIDPREGSLEEIQEIIIEASKAAMNIDERITRLVIQCTNDLNLQYYSNSEGSWIESFVPSTFLQISAIAKEGAKSKFARNRFAVSSSYDVLTYSDPIGLAKKVATEAIELLSAKEHPRGKMPIIVNNFISGTICSSFSNFLKAQNAFGESAALNNPYANKIGEKIGSELLTVTNEPNLEGMPVYYEHDAEGVLAIKTVLIEQGALKTFISDRATASKMNSNPTGCTRALNATHPPVAEFSNIIIKTGDYTLPELIEDISNGIYVTNLAGASTVGSKAMITSESGFIIKNGELTDQVDQVSFGFDLSKDLLNIDAVGHDFAPNCLHHYSGQYYALIGTGTPHLRFSSLEVK